MPPNRRGKEVKERKLASGEGARHLEEAREQTRQEQWERGPKKQFIRRNGWLEVIRNYLASRQAAGFDEPPKYLTLPGRNAMDIGLLYREGILSLSESGRLNVAICDAGQGTEIANSLAKVGQVLAFSDRKLNDELRDSVNPIPREFPFDIINLDFCNSLLRHEQDNLDSLQWIFEYQRGKGFLLLLTARETENINRYRALIQENLDREPSFRAQYENRFGGPEINRVLANTINFSQIVFQKIVARLALKYGYGIIRQFSGYYHRNPGVPNLPPYHMLCFSLELEPLGKRGANKYKPRFPKVGEDRILEILGDAPHRATIKAAKDSYSRFVGEIAEGNLLYIDELLAQEDQLCQELEREGNELSGWLQQNPI